MKMVIQIMNDHFIIIVNNKTIFNSEWLDPENPSYIDTQGKIIRNPNPPDYFIETLPKNFTVVGFAEMGFDKIVSWLQKIFIKDIIAPIRMSDLLHKAKSEILIDLNTMKWSDIIENSQRCIILDIWAEAIQISTKDLNTIVFHNWEYFISPDFYIIFKEELFSAEGIDNWHLFKTVKNWYQMDNKNLELLKNRR